MKFGTLIVGLAGLFCTQALEGTQEEAHKFLIDNGHAAADSEVQSYMVDRNGNVRLQILQEGNVVSYGLEPGTDDFEIVFMSKNRGKKPRKTDEQIDQELGQLIGEQYAVLKGGQVGTVTRSSQKNRQQFEADYTLNGVAYKVSGRYNHKRGELLINKIEQQAGEGEKPAEKAKQSKEL